MKIPKKLANELLECSKNDVVEKFKCIDSGTWEDDGKYDLLQKIFQDIDTNKLYALYDVRSGSYYSDYYYGHEGWEDEVKLEEVVAKEITKTIYVSVKNEN